MPKKEKVTTRDIAAKCGLSQTSVSMILSGKEGVHFSKETMEKVRKTAESMGYKYKKKKQKEENLANRTILVMVPSLSSQYYTTIITAITEYAEKLNLNTSTCITMREEKQEKHYLKLCEQAGFYGIICTYAPKSIEAINAFYKKNPFVLMNDYNPLLKVGLVELDSYKSGTIIAEHLIGLGHKNVAYLTTPLNANEIPRIRRLEGIKDSFRKAGMPEGSVQTYSLTDYQWKNYCIGNRYYDAGVLLTEQYLRNPNNITAFIGNNDIIAIGAMDTLLKHGHRIPDEYSVCGFDNTLVTEFHGISLTSIDHSLHEKGKDAVDMIMKQKQHLQNTVNKGKSPLLRLIYEPILFARNSTGQAP